MADGRQICPDCTSVQSGSVLIELQDMQDLMFSAMGKLHSDVRRRKNWPRNGDHGINLGDYQTGGTIHYETS